jgi:hypothetical protein
MLWNDCTTDRTVNKHQHFLLGKEGSAFSVLGVSTQQVLHVQGPGGRDLWLCHLGTSGCRRSGALAQVYEHKQQNMLEKWNSSEGVPLMLITNCVCADVCVT